MVAKVKVRSKKSKKNYTSKEPEVFWYLNAKGEKLWGFRYKYYDALGNRREKPKQGLTSENIAIRELLKVKTDLINGNVKQVDNSNLTVSEWMDIWFDTNKNDWEITSIKHRKQVIKDHVKPFIGKYKLMELDRTTYKREFINKHLKNFSPGTVQLFHQIFKIAINAAVEDEILTRNRFNKITIVDDTVADNFLTAEELRKYLIFAKSNENTTNYTMILLLAFTGMRKGEMQGLQWANIDFEQKTITVERTRDGYGVRKPKTKNSYRTILIDDILVQQLKSYKIWCKALKLSKGTPLTENDFVFLAKTSGNPVVGTTVGYSMNRVADKTGIKRITPHGLRHTHATILIGEGIPLQTIANKLGNTPEVILKVYGHALEEFEIKSVIAFGKAVNL